MLETYGPETELAEALARLGAVYIDADELRSNRPDVWARALVEFAISSMGGAK